MEPSQIALLLGLFNIITNAVVVVVVFIRTAGLHEAVANINTSLKEINTKDGQRQCLAHSATMQAFGKRQDDHAVDINNLFARMHELEKTVWQSLPKESKES